MRTDRRTAAIVLAAVAVIALVRARFVHLLTITTGTWIGSPPRIGPAAEDPDA